MFSKNQAIQGARRGSQDDGQVRRLSSDQLSTIRASNSKPSTSINKDRFVLRVPSAVNIKGDPPHWARELFLEPLLDGWTREIVIRGTQMKNKKADIYYFAPDGTKFRSRREVGQYLLDNRITKYSPIHNFWFQGKILGKEFSPYEVVRKTMAKMESPKPRTNTGRAPARKLKTVSEEEMVYDEEIEIDSEQAAVFDPAALSPLRDLNAAPIPLPTVKEIEEPRLPVPKEKRAPLNIPKKRKIPAEELAKLTRTNIPKKRKIAAEGLAKLTKTKDPKTKDPDAERCYCICDDIEHGKMVLCDNDNCEIGWYHFECISIKNSPPGLWYCPICRGPTSDTVNPAYGVQKELCN